MGLNFLLSFLSHRNFLALYGKTIVYRSGAILRPSDYQPTFSQCTTEFLLKILNFKLFLLLLFTCYWRPWSTPNHDVAVIQAVAGVSSVDSPTVNGAHALDFILMLLLKPMHLLVFLLFLALLLLDSLHYKWCPCCCLFFLRPCQKSLPDFSGPWKETFCIPKCRKSLLVPGMQPFTFTHAGKLWPWSQARSPSRGQTFMAWRNVKCLIPETWRLFLHLGALLPGTWRVFWHWGMWKRSMGGGKNVLVSTAGLSILDNVSFWWELKQKGFLHSVGQGSHEPFYSFIPIKGLGNYNVCI